MAQKDANDADADEERVLVQARVSPAIAKLVDDRARELELSHAAILRMALKGYFAGLMPSKDKKR